MVVEKIHVKTVVFDLDGTLVDSQEDIIITVNHMLRELGMDVKSADVIRSYIGSGRRQLILDALGDRALPATERRGTEIFREYYAAHMMDHSRLYPGVIEVLDYLRDKKLGILTNKNRELTIKTLEHFSLVARFAHVKGGDNERCMKPDSCPLTDVLSVMDSSPETTLMVGDSDIDVKTGKMAGAHTCGVTYGIGSPEKLKAAEPDFVIDDIRVLKDLIR